MSNRDVFEQEPIIIFLDKPYVIKFTMRVVYTLENIYETMTKAESNLRDEDTNIVVATVIDFLSVLLGIDKKTVEDKLDIDRLMKAMGKIQEAIQLHFPDADKNAEHSAEPQDWDWLYYVAKYRLKMSYDEFMNCTPRKFDKLYYLWRIDNGFEKLPEKQVFIDQIAGF